MYLFHARPLRATSWEEFGVVVLAGITGAIVIQVQVCHFGITPATDQDPTHAKKLAGFPTNAQFIVDGLGRLCNGDHGRVPLEGHCPGGSNKTSWARVRLMEPCVAICRGSNGPEECRRLGVIHVWCDTCGESSNC